MTIKNLLAGVACTMFAGFGALSGAMAQDAPAPSGTIAASTIALRQMPAC